MHVPILFGAMFVLMMRYGCGAQARRGAQGFHRGGGHAASPVPRTARKWRQPRTFLRPWHNLDNESISPGVPAVLS